MTNFKIYIKIIALICLIYCNKYVLIDILDNYIKNIKLNDIYDTIIEHIDIITLIIYLFVIYNYR